MEVSSHAKILRKAYYDLKQKLKPDEIMDYLLSKGVLTDCELEKCRETPGRPQQCGELIEILMYKDEDGYKHFCIILERTQSHLKTMLDEIARNGGASEFIYVKESFMEQAVSEKEKIIFSKDKEIEKKTQYLQSQEAQYEEKVEKLKGNHAQEKKQIKDENSASMMGLNNRMKKLNTELKQEQDKNKTAEKTISKQTQEYTLQKDEILMLKQKCAKTEEKYEAVTKIEMIKNETMEILQETKVISFAYGRCVLKTSADCNEKHLHLLSCFHAVCKSCIDKMRCMSFECKCGRQIDMEREALPLDVVSINKAMLSTENLECGYLRDPCLEKALFYCITCNTPLCADCHENHRRPKHTACHDVSTIDKIFENPPWRHPNISRCSDHPERQLAYMDKDCKKTICHVCFKGTHEEHSVIALEKEYAERKRHLTNVVQQHEGQLARIHQTLTERRDRLCKIQQMEDEVVKQITVIHERIAVKWLHRRKDLLLKVKEESNTLQVVILKDIASISKSISIFETTIEYARMSFDYTSQVQLLELTDFISKKMAEDLVPTCLEGSGDNGLVRFYNKGERALEELVEMFGDVRVMGTPVLEGDDILTIRESKENSQAMTKEVQTLQKLVKELSREKDALKKEFAENEHTLRKDMDTLQISVREAERVAKENKEKCKNAETDVKKLQASLRKRKKDNVQDGKEVRISWITAACVMILLITAGIKYLTEDKSDDTMNRMDDLHSKTQKKLIADKKVYKKIMANAGLITHVLPWKATSVIVYLTPLEYDRERVNLQASHINLEGALVNQPSTEQHVNSNDRIVNYRGTSSVSSLPRIGSAQYWEVRANVHIGKPISVDGGLILQLGLCREGDRDLSHRITDLPHTYKLSVFYSKYHNSICRRSKKDGNAVDIVTDTLPNTAGSQATLHYGVLYDDSRAKIAFIDIGESRVISILNNPVSTKPIWLMFGVYQHDMLQVEMKLITGKNIEMTDVKKQMILNALL